MQLALRQNKRRFQKLKGIFISHMHGDHVLGLPGVLSTMSLLGRKEALDIWGPPPLEEWLTKTWESIDAHLSFPIHVHSWTTDAVGLLHEGERYRILSIPVKHRIACCGLRVEEHSLPWSLDGAKVKQANLPFHVRQALKRGNPSNLVAKLKPSMWGTAPRDPRSYVFSSDTRPCQSLLHAAQGAS